MKVLFRLVTLFLISVRLLGQDSGDLPPKPSGHQRQNIEGWTVQVDERLLSGTNAALGTHTLRLLSSRLYDLKYLLPADKLAVLQQYTIWVDESHGKLTSAQYHPSADWLRENGYSEMLAKCVHIPDAKNFSSAAHHKIQPWSILHELAHAYHDQVLRFNNQEIRKAWENLKGKEQYQNVLHRGGGTRKHYALTDPMEFFAEMTEAFFAENDFYPFNRAELKQAEPEIFQLLQKIWEGESNLKPTKNLPLPGEVFEVAGRTCFLIKPETASKIKGWVWYAPTLPAYPATEEKWMFERFLSNGIAIAGIDVGESYGSPEGTDLFNKFHKQMVEERGYAKKPVLLARSRGGLMLYNWAIAHPDSAQAIAGIYPVGNLESYPGLEKAAPAYKMSPEELRRNLSQYNPIARASVLAEKKVPIFHIHGDVDTVVPLELNSDPIKAAYKKASAPMKLVIPQGQGHNMWEGFFQSQELVDFVIKHGNEAVEGRK